MKNEHEVWMRQKPGMFQSWGECFIRMALGAVFVACIVVLALWVAGRL